jgi:hypothetical protein
MTMKVLNCLIPGMMKINIMRMAEKWMIKMMMKKSSNPTTRIKKIGLIIEGN